MFRPSSALFPYTSGFDDDPDITSDTEIGERLPLVFGQNVYVSNATVLSHRISVSVDSLRLIHSVVSLISLGQTTGDPVGEIINLDQAAYKHGVRIGRSSATTGNFAFDDWRSGTQNQNSYATHANRALSYPIESLEITIPARLLNGVAVTSGVAFWHDGTQWNSQALTPNTPATLPDWASWVTLNLNETTAFSGMATALTRFASPIGEFQAPDFKVLEGKRIWRIIQAGSGSLGTIDFATTSVIDLNEGDEYTDATSAPAFAPDEPWLAVQSGLSDRFPDVLFYLARTGLSDLIALESLFDYDSLISANEHVDAESLHVNGVLETNFSINELVNVYAKFFDLIPYRTESQLGLLPHTVAEPVIEALFTPVNHRNFSFTYLDYTERNVNVLHALINDWSAPDYQGAITYNAIGALAGALSYRMDAHLLQNNQAALDKQLKRCYESLSQQSLQIELLSPNPLTLEPGDFILASDPSVISDRAYAGGILSNLTGATYELSIPVETTRLTLAERSVNNSFVYLTSGYLDVQAGDFIVIDAISQDERGRIGSVRQFAEISQVSVNIINDQYRTGVAVIPKRWANNAWIDSNETFQFPSGTQTTLYPLTLSSGSGIFLDGSARIVQSAVSFSLFLNETSNEIKYAMTFGNYDGSVTLPSPLIIEAEPTTWRISLIEPVFTPRDRFQQIEKGTVVYRVVAQNYPFGQLLIPSAISGAVETTPTAVVNISVTRQTFPDFDFSAFQTIPDLAQSSFDPALPNWPFTLPIPLPLTPTGDIAFDPGAPTEPDTTDLTPVNPAILESDYVGGVLLIPVSNEDNDSFAAGFVISNDGLFVTNEHVFANYSGANVAMFDGQQYEIEWLFNDPGSDIAVGRLKSVLIRPVPVYADIADLKDGDTVYALGHPISGGTQSFWQRTSSTIDPLRETCTPNGVTLCYRTVDGLLESGSSGAPIFNSFGQLVGMGHSIKITGGVEHDYFIPVEVIRETLLRFGYQVITNGYTGNPSDAVTLGDYSRPEAIDLFYELAFGEGLTLTAGVAADYTNVINKWPVAQSGALSVGISGLYSDGDLGDVETDVNSLSGAIALADSALFPDNPGNLQLTGKGVNATGLLPAANINFILLPADQYDLLLTAHAPIENGFTWVEIDPATREITQAYSLIKATSVTPDEKKRTIYRELFRALGLFGETNQYPQSIFYPNTSATIPSDKDLAALRILYQFSLISGHTQAYAADILPSIGRI